MADNGNGWSNGGTNGGGVLFTNVRILDGTGEYPYTGEVLVQGNRIKSITKGSSRFSSSSSMGGGQTVIDGMGATLMPGLIDAHLHLSWNNAPGIDPIQMMETEEHMLVTMEMAKIVLDAGFTAGRGAAAAKPRLDVVAKRFINEGRFPGPRYLAAGPEITTVGGLGDAAPSHIPHEGLNLGIVVSGPEEIRRTVRTLIKYGVDSIKLNLSGEEITGMGAEETPMSEEEVAMAVQEARCRNKVLSAHARSSGSVKQCVRHGIQNIYHASFADEEALDMLEANKDKHFVAPGLAWLIQTSRGAAEWGIKPGTPVTMAYERELEHAVETCRKMHKRGIRVLIGGDYGFAWTPQGTNAKDLEYFVEFLGFSPMEAILAGTKYGGQIMGMGDELGQIKQGYLADMLLVDGDPISNVRVLIGGDYGFAWTPQGTNAKDLEYFIEFLGFSPMEAIIAGTKYGGQIMGMGDELGQIKQGYLADMLLVDGDPISNVRVLQDKSRILAIMKDGQFHRAPKMNAQGRRLTA